LVVFGMATAMVLAWSVGRVQGQKAEAKKVIFASANQADYKPMGKAEGVTQAGLWGNPDKGGDGTVTKFKPGYDAGMHSHTNDVWIVGIKGAYLYEDDDGEKRVGPGDFLRVPGGHKHGSGGDKNEGALFYEEGSAKFDLIPAK